MMRCRPGIVTRTGLARSRISGAPLREELRAAPHPGHTAYLNAYGPSANPLYQAGP
jgi:hypothetical protein